MALCAAGLLATVDYLKIENIISRYTTHKLFGLCVVYDNEMCARVKRLWFQKGFVIYI